MIQQRGIWFPDDVGEKWRHAFMHVQSIEWAIRHCAQRRTAVQAGGNIGLWPRRLAEVFARVITFEPEPIVRACLERNVPAFVEVHDAALGAALGECEIRSKSLGGHRVIAGTGTPVVPLDAWGLEDLDYLQLDIEGYEGQALIGARETIARCRPMIQIELRNQATRYGQSDDLVRAWLRNAGYEEVSRQQGSDVVFGPIARAA